MRRARRPLAAVLVAVALLLLTWGALRVFATEESEERQRRGHRIHREGGSFEAEEGEAESIRDRVLDYLRRHGDRERIDPERQRQRVAAEYERYRKEAATRRPVSAGIGGTDWISLGPTNGAGRMTAIAFVPGFPNTVYAGSAGGGVWKTLDGGATWAPLTDGLHDLSVGALAVAPSNPSIVYLGTGEGGYSSVFIPGIGFLKSTDDGATWTLPSSVLATTFYRILVHPTNANELVAGTNAGAFRSVDGGATWTNVISHTDYGDVPDIVRDPSNPLVLYATTWCAVGTCTFRSARVLRSADGGVTWSDRSAGLPTTVSGLDERTSIAISPASSQVLYAARAVHDTVHPSNIFSHIYKTTDGGASWTDLPSVTGNTDVAQYMSLQSWYDNTLVVSPNDPNVVIAGGVGYIRSSDGGASFSRPFPQGGGPHVDYHDLRYNGSRLWIANDGGIWSSDDDGRTVADHNDGLVTRQFYALASDPNDRRNIVAGAQDNGSIQRVDPGTLWRVLEGGDGIECAILPLSPQIAWISFQHGGIERTRGALSDSPTFELVPPPFEGDEVPPFLTVVKLDPRAPGTLYTGSGRLWISRDGGDTWRPLPTVTSDGSVWSATVGIVSLALPAGDSPLVIVAKGRGVFRSADAGNTWAAGRGLPNAVVNHVAIDPRDPSVAYASIATTLGPSLYRSADGGLNWTASANGLPLFSAQVLRVDPTDSSDLFCGTDVGVFRSTDRGANWTRFGTNLPSTSIHDVEIFEDGSLLRVATHGRGIWELSVPPTGNTPPTASITAPAGPVSITVGAAVAFAGSVADPDTGDSVSATWFFPDDGTLVPLPPSGSVTHTFHRSGVFPIALSARDSFGARGSGSFAISVREPFDSCATPAVLPGGGPFPYTLAWSNEAGSSEATDPKGSCVPGVPLEGSTWFEFTPVTAGLYSFSICTEFSTLIGILTGPACGPYTAVAFACSPFDGSSDCGDGAVSVTASAQAGQTLRILVGGAFVGGVGENRLTVAPAASPANAPRVDRVGDAQGPVSGSTAVVIMGSGFEDGASVSFGGVPATAVSVLASGVITAQTPPHAAGPVDVAVTVPGAGTATLGSGFRYETVEVVTRVAPAPARKRPPARRVDPRPSG